MSIHNIRIYIYIYTCIYIYIYVYVVSCVSVFMPLLCLVDDLLGWSSTTGVTHLLADTPLVNFLAAIAKHLFFVCYHCC